MMTYPKTYDEAMSQWKNNNMYTCEVVATTQIIFKKRE
jgi:hypothetical protein